MGLSEGKGTGTALTCFEPKLYLYKYPNNLVQVILLVDTTYKDRTDRVFRNVRI
jgi:hypothetical protein